MTEPFDLSTDGGPALAGLSLEFDQEKKLQRFALTSQLSVRDYFAAAALQALVSRYGDGRQDHAEFSYKLADAMLKERNKP
jgi:hypothetical protein